MECITTLGPVHSGGSQQMQMSPPLRQKAQTAHYGLVLMIGQMEMMYSEAVSVIRAAILWKKKRKLRMGPKFRDVGLVFCGPRGRPINPSNLRNRDHLPHLERLKLPRIRPHEFAPRPPRT